MFADYYVEDLEDFNLRDFIECVEEDLENRIDEIEEDLRICISIYFVNENKKIEEDIYFDDKSEAEDAIYKTIDLIYNRIKNEIVWL